MTSPGQARQLEVAQACNVIAVETTPPAAADTLNGGASRDLLGVCRSVIEGSTELIKFVDQNRESARNVGVETIAIELAGIIEGGSLSRVRDTLEEALVKNWPAQVTHEGLGKLRRAESLLADATRELDKELGVKRSLGDVGDGVSWVPFVILGAAAAVAGAYFLTKQDSHSPVAVPNYKVSGKKKKSSVSGSDSKQKK